MEGISRLITTTKRDGRLKGLKMSDLCYLTHLLFVDDVLIFLDGSIRDSTTFHEILTLFTHAAAKSRKWPKIFGILDQTT